jgi:serine/threonine protein phosphatase PrpC
MTAICPICREPAATATDRFCEVCGARLGAPGSDVADRVEVDLTELAGVSDRGHVHLRNEDAMALGRRPENGNATTLAAVVCDGVSTVRRPELASHTAATVALEALLAADVAGEPGMIAAIAAAAAAVGALAPDAPDAPSCTLVAALVDAATGAITVGWVGDSRAYWLPPEGPAEQLTEDDSWATHAIAMGADPIAAMRDPKAHAITAWLGADAAPVLPRTGAFTVVGAGHLVLCSDGLWNYLPDPEAFAATVRAHLHTGGTLISAARGLVEFANESGGADNITVALIPVSSPTPPDTAAEPVKE